MKYIKAVYKSFDAFGKKLQRDAVAAFSAQAAFFIIISAFPLLMLIIAVMQYLPFVDISTLNYLAALFPDKISDFIQKIISEIFSGSSVAIIPVSAVALLWAASKGMMSILRGLNFIYGIEERRNYFFVRFLAVIYTIGFVITLLLMLVLVVFGNSLLNLISEKLPSFYGTALLIASFRTLGVFVLMTLFFLLLYIVIPNRRANVFTELPGAVLSALGWLGFSWLYGLYIDNFANSSYVYGSLAAAVFIMLWLYFCMYILFIGGEVNSILRAEEFRKMRIRRREERELQKKKKEIKGEK